MSLESKHFVASLSDIETLAGSIIDADQRAQGGKGRYFKALLATTQHELGVAPRQRNATGQHIGETVIEQHLKALHTVSDRFYSAVVRVARATVPAPDAALMRSRTSFARSALSTIRGYIKAGGDITLLAAHKTTKHELARPVKRRKLTVDALRRRAETLSKQLWAVCGPRRKK